MRIFKWRIHVRPAWVREIAQLVAENDQLTRQNSDLRQSGEALRVRAYTAEAQLADCKERHAVTEREACDRASEVGRLTGRLNQAAMALEEAAKIIRGRLPATASIFDTAAERARDLSCESE